MSAGIESRLPYGDRENIKRFAYQGEALQELIILLIHFDAQTTEQRFSVFASEWAEYWDDRDAAAPIRKWWPLDLSAGGDNV